MVANVMVDTTIVFNCFKLNSEKPTQNGFLTKERGRTKPTKPRKLKAVDPNRTPKSAINSLK